MGLSGCDSHDKTQMDEGLLLIGEQRKWFLEMECTPGEDYQNDNEGFRTSHKVN